MDSARKVSCCTMHQVSPVKTAADALGISQRTWYRHPQEFRTTVYAAHQRILAENMAQRDALPSAPDLTD